MTARSWTAWAVMVFSGLVALASNLPAEEATWNYVVEVSAVVSSSPAQIALSWPEDTWATDAYKPTYTVRRRGADAGTWEASWTLGAGVTTFTDRDVQPGRAYEYEVSRTFQNPAAPELDHVAYGYILSGIDVPFADHRGRMLLVIEDRIASALASAVTTLQGDLVGDGWTVSTLVVSAGDAPTAVRQRIAGAYFTGSERPSVLFLLGHVPVVKSGSTWLDYTGGPNPIELIPVAPDGHDPRPLSCDAFYADVDGAWTDANGDGVYENDGIPSDVEMAVGRVDFADLPSLGTDDVTLTARYLEKDHAFRQGALRFDRRALLADRIGVDYYRAPAGGGYRNFSTFYGPQNITVAPAEDATADGDRWIAYARGRSFAWAFGAGAGSPGSAAYLGTQGPYKVVTSQDLAGDVHVGFYLLFGSFFVDWSQPDDLLRSALAAPAAGLGAGWSGRPTMIMHRMALGEPVATGVRLTQNNDGSLYFSPANAFRRGVHIAWLGDPTLRLEYPAPPANLTGTRSGTTTDLAWQANSEASVGYVVYRGDRAQGPFARLTDGPLGTPHFSDAASPAGAVYLVRAVRLDQTASGTYENPSTGAMWISPAINPPEQPPPLPITNAPGVVNLSTRLRLTPDSAATAGFVVAGNAPQSLLIRAVGPSLTSVGIARPVSDPRIQLFDHAGAALAGNDGWNDDPQVASAGASVGAFKLGAGSRDAALLVTLAPGSYTAQVSASDSGTALLEVYALGAASGQSPLANLSTRGTVASGDDVMVAGLTIAGSSPVRILLRAVGPGLAGFGVPGVLADPVLTLYRQQDVIAQNNDWEAAQPGASVPLVTNAADIATASNQVGAFPLPAGGHDAAMVVTLNPGAYTAIVSGAGGGTGAALVEAYQLP